MPRPIEEIKDRLSLVDYLGRDLALVREGGHYKALCPFHAEKSPSLHVWEDSYTCFGCGAHGDILTYVQTRQGLSFLDALRLLAKDAGVTLHEDPEMERERATQEARASLLKRAAALYHALLTPEARAYLNRRGFTDPFIDTYLMGYAPGGVLPRLGATVAELQGAGLVNQAGRDYFWGRIILPLWGRYAGEIVGLVGRAFPGDGPPKYLALPGPAVLIHERGLRMPEGRQPDGTRVVYLCEGDTDTATLVQAGLPAVGVRGAHALKPEHAERFARIDTIYVCADADAAGDQLRETAGALFGNRARILALPDGADVNSYVGQQGLDITALAARAPSFVDWLLARVPRDIPSDQVDAQIQTFIPALKQLGKGAQEAYAKRLARTLGITITPIREELRTTLAQNGNGHARDAVDQTRIIWQDKVLINPAQALVGDVMLTTVFLEKLVVDPETDSQRLMTLPHVVTSQRELFELTDAEMHQRGWRYAPTKVPVYSISGQRWAVGESHPHSVKQYIDGGVAVQPWDVYTEVVSYFRRFVDYPNPLYHDYLALWTIGTYVFDLFQSYPYTHLNGTKRCGKTLTMEIINELAFNALISASLSSASAYRTVEACSATLLIDEAENLQKRDKDKEQGDDKLEILKAGYKKGAKVIRCSGDDHEPTGFDVYSPKMFGSVGQIDRILADRTITLTLARKRPGTRLHEFRMADITPTLRRTRDKLYILMLEHGREIAERIAEGIGWDGVTDRDRELWTPLLVLAMFFDDAYIDQVGEDAIVPADLLTARMRRLAHETVIEREARERMEQTEVLVVEGTLEFLETATPVVEDFHGAKALLEFLKARDGLTWLTDTRQVYRELEKVTAIQKSRDLALKRPAGSGTGIKPIRCIRLNRKQLEDVGQRIGVQRACVTDM